MQIHPPSSGRARVLLLSAAVALGLATLFGCHDSNSGGKKIKPPASLPPIVVYLAEALPAPLAGTGVRGRVEVSALHMMGVYDLDKKNLELDPSFVFMLDPIPLFGPMDVWVTQGLVSSAGAHPTAGQVQILQDPVTITVTVNPDVTGLGDPGVDIVSEESGVPGGAASLTWAELYAVDATSPLYQQLAEFGFFGAMHLSGRIVSVIDALGFITENAKKLENNGSGVALVELCDFMPGPDVQGQRTVTWFDDSGDGKLGPMDRFTVDLDACWLDDPTVAFDILLDGVLAIADYIQVEAPFSAGGEVLLTDLVATETEEVAGEVDVLLETAITLNGGFDLLLTD